MAELAGHKLRRSASQGGFTLIEALIAFIILSVGLLGIVSLQAMAKTSQHLAIQHTRAVTIADAMVERIRANPAGIEVYNIGLNPLGSGSLGSTPEFDCRSGACNDPEELAAYDLWVWEQALDGAGAKVTVDGGSTNTAGLISPQGCIVFTPGPDLPASRTRTGLLSVIIQWRGLHESSDALQAGDAVCGEELEEKDVKFRRQVVANTYVVDEREFK